MPCYKSGGCGVYEGLSCNDCPASKPEYIFRDESPCRECDHGWGSMTSTSIQSCHDTCQELKQWNERRIKFMNYDSNKQPRICEIIGVNVGEIFRIKGYMAGSWISTTACSRPWSLVHLSTLALRFNREICFVH